MENCRSGWCFLVEGLQEWAQSLQRSGREKMGMAVNEIGEH